jgi:hypothetical protein
MAHVTSRLFVSKCRFFVMQPILALFIMDGDHNPAVGKPAKRSSVNGFIHTQLFFICLRLFYS